MRRILVVVALVATVLPLTLTTAPAGAASAVQVEKVRFGPFDLDAMGGAHWQDEGAGAIPRPAGAYAIKAMYFDVVDGAGNPVMPHDVHLHHFVMLEAGQPDPMCGNLFGNASVLGGTGSEKTPIEFGDPYGYLVDSGDTWAANWHIMNMSDQARQVYIEYEVHYDPDGDASNTRSLTPHWIDVDGCGNAEWNVPGNGGPGSIYTNTRTVTMPDAGLLVGVGGHLHDGGIANELRRTSDDQLLCRNEVDYTTVPHFSISTCTDLQEPIAAGEQLRIDSIYDNSQPYDAVMGIDVAYVWLGGTPDPTPSVGAISGTVTDETTTGPIEGLTVRLHDGNKWIDWVLTDANGDYTFADLDPGTYRVRVDDPTDTYPREFWDDATTMAWAADIPLTAGQTHTADFALTPYPMPPVPQTCSPLGPWDQWMPPMDWTQAEIEAAQGLICDAQLEMSRVDTVQEVAALGFTNLNDSAVTGYEHWVNYGRLNNDNHIMELDFVESVVFKVETDGSRTLAAFMPMLPQGSTMNDIPPEWQFLPGWHIHDNLCFNSSGQIVGVTDADGNCAVGNNVVTPPMVHVWVTHNVCDNPFAGVDENGVQCDGHDHQH